MEKLIKPTIQAATLGLVVSLAACADGPKEGEPSTPTTTPQAQNPARTSQDRVALSECSEPAQGRVFFELGSSVLGVPAQAVRDAIPASLTPPMTKEAIQTELQTQAANGGGCPGKPIQANLVMMQAAGQHPLLEGTIGVLGNPPRAMTERFAEVTRGLQRKPTQNCQDLGGSLLGCVGTETRGQNQTQVLYVISTDTSQTLASGGPLAARCVMVEGKVAACNLFDRLPGDIVYDATLKPGKYTLEGLVSARDTAVASIDNMRRR